MSSMARAQRRAGCASMLFFICPVTRLIGSFSPNYQPHTKAKHCVWLTFAMAYD